jgi:8-oxo-dGTP pyrophosphatase MutT (NUDIX family)
VIHIATGLALRNGRILMVASRYASHLQPLWNLPGGRQQSGELLVQTVEREVLEETGLRAEVGELAYVSESYDGAEHILNATFRIEVSGEVILSPSKDGQSDHVVEVAWVPVSEVSERVVVGVVREPLLAYVRGELTKRYAGFHEAGITIEWPHDSR